MVSWWLLNNVLHYKISCFGSQKIAAHLLCGVIRHVFILRYFSEHFINWKPFFPHTSVSLTTGVSLTLHLVLILFSFAFISSYNRLLLNFSKETLIRSFYSCFFFRNTFFFFDNSFCKAKKYPFYFVWMFSNVWESCKRKFCAFSQSDFRRRKKLRKKRVCFWQFELFVSERERFLKAVPLQNWMGEAAVQTRNKVPFCCSVLSRSLEVVLLGLKHWAENEAKQKKNSTTKKTILLKKNSVCVLKRGV